MEAKAHPVGLCSEGDEPSSRRASQMVSGESCPPAQSGRTKLCDTGRRRLTGRAGGLVCVTPSEGGERVPSGVAPGGTAALGVVFLEGVERERERALKVSGEKRAFLFPSTGGRSRRRGEAAGGTWKAGGTKRAPPLWAHLVWRPRAEASFAPMMRPSGMRPPWCKPRPLPALCLVAQQPGSGDCLSLSAASWTSQDSWFPW